MAECCNITLTGITRDCTNTLGGIRRIFLADWCDVTVTVTDDVVSAITNTDKWYEYNFRKNTGNFVSTLNKDDTTGNRYVSSVITLQLKGLDPAKRLEISNIARGELAAIVEDSNGRYWYFGYDDVVEIGDGSTAETGTAKADFNGYNITLVDDSSDFPYPVPQSVMDTILNPTPAP